MRITFRANTPRDRVNESSALVVTAKVWDDGSTKDAVIARNGDETVGTLQ